ncbi:MAG: CopG family transcriptional regulator [Candidatus Acidiferrales bacterium]
MRTTLTLDSDVAALLNRLLRARKTSFKQLVNDALRLGLQTLGSSPPKRRRTYTRTVDLGPCLVESIDDVAEILALGEGEDYK